MPAMTSTAPRAHPARTLPLVAWLLGVPGIACLIGGLAVLGGAFASHHPVLAEPGTGIVLIVSALALLGSAAFPVALQRLAARDAAAERPPSQ